MTTMGLRGRQAKQDCKFEIRNSKQFQMIKKAESSKQIGFGFDFHSWDLGFWVCFGFRYSSFGFCFAGVLRNNLGAIEKISGDLS
jgi:hypothetical protein